MATATLRQVTVTMPMGDMDFFASLAKKLSWTTSTVVDAPSLQPNATTLKALEEISGKKKLKRYNTVDSLMADLMN